MKLVSLLLFVLLLVSSITGFSQISTRAKLPPSTALDKGNPKTASGFTSVPLAISYQGLMTTSSGAPVPDGSYDITFALFQSPTAGTEEWSETHSTVAVSKGTYSVILGSITSLNTFDFNRQLYLEINVVAGPPGPAYTLTFPRSALTSAPSALAPWTVNSGNINYNSGNVGIGTAGPTEKLEVDGNIRLSGDITYSTQRTGYVTGTAWALGRALFSSGSFTYAGGIYNDGAGTDYYEVPLQLPDGVTLTEVNVYGLDLTAADDLYFFVGTQPLTSGGGNIEASGSSGDAFAGGAFTISVPLSLVIDNSANAYYLELEMPNTPTIAFYSFRATYTYTSEGYSASQLQSPTNRSTKPVENTNIPFEHYGGSIRKNK